MIFLRLVLVSMLLIGSAFATTESTAEVQESLTNYQIESIVEKGVVQCTWVQDVKCNVLDNKSLLMKIYVSDKAIKNTTRFVNLQMLRAAIRGHALAISMDYTIEDMEVQLCNSTGVICTMRSSRALINAPFIALVKDYGTVATLTTKMVSTMVPDLETDQPYNPIREL